MPGATGQLHAFANGKQQRAVTPGRIKALFIIECGINPAQCKIQSLPGLAEGDGVISVLVFTIGQESFFTILATVSTFIFKLVIARMESQ